MEKRVIGLSGVSRCGKDTFCNLLIKNLIKRGIVAERLALADDLKSDLRQFCLDKIKIDSFTTDTKEKTLIRGLFVEYGNVQRVNTMGRYWTDKLQPKIDDLLSKNVIPIITDIRYDFYEKDEVFWLKNENNGVLVHITRYEYIGDDVHYLVASNKHEEENDPKLYLKSDKKIFCEQAPSCEDAERYFGAYVERFINWYLNR